MSSELIFIETCKVDSSLPVDSFHSFFKPCASRDLASARISFAFPFAINQKLRFRETRKRNYHFAENKRYGVANRNCVSKSTLLYQGSQ